MNYLLSGILLLLLVSLSGCENETVVTEPQLRPVRYLTVTDPTGFRTRTFSGSSRSTQESRLSFKISGTIVSIPIQVGEDLKAGDLVAELDPSQYELQVQQAQASLVQAQAGARNARSNYERVKGLYENNNASRNDLDSARTSAESAFAQQRAMQKSLELARLNLSYTQLRVDADCSVARLSVELNENITPGGQVAQVNCGEELEVAIDAPEGVIASIRQDMPADIRFNAIPGSVYKGKVAEIGVASTNAASSFPVSVKLDQPDGKLRSGLAADVTFAFSDASTQSAFLIPLAAVINDVSGPFVYVADPASEPGEALVRRQSVELGELTDDGMEIFTGITSGDRVITAGVSVIRDGQRVLLP